MSQDLLVQQDGPVLRITLNRPDNGNGMTDAMALQFAEVVGKAHETKTRMTVLILFKGGELKRFHVTIVSGSS